MGGLDITGAESKVKSIESLIRDLQKQKEWCQGQIKVLSGQTYKDSNTKRTIESHRKRISQLNEKIADAKKRLASAKAELREAKKRK